MFNWFAHGGAIVSALGLAGLALYDFSNGDAAGAGKAGLAALGFLANYLFHFPSPGGTGVPPGSK